MAKFDSALLAIGFRRFRSTERFAPSWAPRCLTREAGAMGSGASHGPASPEPAAATPRSTSCASTAASTPVGASEKPWRALLMAEAVTRRLRRWEARSARVSHRYSIAMVPGETAMVPGDSVPRAGSGARVRRIRPPRPRSQFEMTTGLQFEMTTPMLVVPFRKFRAQSRIMKSTKAWRDEALAAGSQDRHLHLAHVVGPVLQGRGLELNV